MSNHLFKAAVINMFRVYNLSKDNMKNNVTMLKRVFLYEQPSPYSAASPQLEGIHLAST